MYVCMRSLDFLQIFLVKIPFGGRAWGKGKKKKEKRKKKQTSWQQTVIVNLKPVPSSIYHKAATIWTTPAAADDTRQQQMCTHSVQETQQYKCNSVPESKELPESLSGLKSITNYNHRLKRIPSPHLTRIGNINIQKQEMNELKCKTIH